MKHPLLLFTLLTLLFIGAVTGTQPSYWQGLEIGSSDDALYTPNNPAYWMAIGQKEINSGNYTRAEKAYRSALSIKHEDPNLLYLLGLVLLKEGRLEEAVPLIARAIAIKPHAAPFYCNLGTAYANRTDYDTAVRYYREAVTLSPSYLLANNNLCLACVLCGDTKGALDSCTRSLLIDTNNPVTWINLADALLLGKHYQEAEDAFRYALRYPLAPSDRKEAEAGLFNATKNRSNPSAPLDPTVSKAIFHAYHASEEITPKTIYPSIIPFDEQGEEPIPVHITFGYNGRPESVSLSLNSSLLRGARAAYKAPIHNNESAAGSLQTKMEWYDSLIHEPHHEAVIASIHTQLTEIQNRSGLHASFLPLATAFVRSLGIDLCSTEIRYPVETIAENAGDCDDKSILLAALLLYHGYDTAIIEFPGHVAVGVTEVGPLRTKSRYTCIETTSDLTFGTVREDLQDHFGLVIPVSRTGSYPNVSYAKKGR